MANRNIPQLACLEFCPGFSGNSWPRRRTGQTGGCVRLIRRNFEQLLGIASVNWTSPVDWPAFDCQF